LARRRCLIAAPPSMGKMAECCAGVGPLFDIFRDQILTACTSRQVSLPIGRRTSVSVKVRHDLRSSNTPRRVEWLLHCQAIRGDRRINSFYDCKEMLGEGAYGSVYCCSAKVEAISRSDVAVKHIRWNKPWRQRYWPSESEQEERIAQELKTLLMVDHRYIARIRDWFEDASYGIYFVMELCEGGSFQELLEQVCLLTGRAGRLGVYAERLRRHFREVADALQYLHAMYIVHCDLKPENMLLKMKDPDSCIKLIDFGLARLNDSSGEEDKWTTGTQLFMAPEQYLQAKGIFTVQMDVWALGVTFAWIITTLELGSLQHPFFDEADGKAFEPEFLDLVHAYRRLSQDGTPEWNRKLFHDQEVGVFELADGMLVMPAESRWSAEQVFRHPWTEEGNDICLWRGESDTPRRAQSQFVATPWTPTMPRPSPGCFGWLSYAAPFGPEPSLNPAQRATDDDALTCKQADARRKLNTCSPARRRRQLQKLRFGSSRSFQFDT